ncbi:hypothetical protein G6F56_013949 [Rhizopus delemar]|nr:hypothetical protein G6F56_013949 [Rhizopus delemar]
MLRDVRKLLLHVGASITNSRNNIALRAINPSFAMKSGNEATYTLPLDEFQHTLIQQTAARKATRDATINKRQRRRAYQDNLQSSGSFSTLPDQQFFRPGPPSQQGGFNNNNTYNNNRNTNSNFRPNNNSNNNNSNNNKRNNNPFRQ